MPASIGEFLDGHEEITSENGFVSLENYSKFWNNLILSDDSVSYFVTISITQLMYLLGGLHRVCPFPGFLTKVCCNPDPLPNNYTKLCKEAEVQTCENIHHTIMYTVLFYDIKVNDELHRAVDKWDQFNRANALPSIALEYLQLLQSHDTNHRYTWLVEKMYLLQASKTQEIIHDQNYLAAACIYPYLRSILYKDPQGMRVIFESITMFLGHPDTTKAVILPLLHVFTQFIIAHPEVNRNILEGAYIFLQRYFLWPKPYSDLAHQILQVLTLEKKAAGSALRDRFLIEHPPLLGGKRTVLDNRVYIFVDSRCPNAEAVAELLKVSELGERTKTEVQINLLGNILHVENQVDLDLLGLEYLNGKDAEKFLQAAVQILKEAVMMSVEDGINFKRRQLQSLQEEILVHCTSSASQVQLNHETPKLPHLDMVIKVIDCQNQQPSPTDIEESGSIFPDRQLFHELTAIFEEHEHIENTPLLRIGLCGNDRTLHHVVGAIAQYQRGTAYRNYDIRYHYIPVGRSHFAEWLGRQDPWWGQTVVASVHLMTHTYPSIIPITSEIRFSKKAKRDTRARITAPQLSESNPMNRKRTASISSKPMLAEMQRKLLLCQVGGSEKTMRPSELRHVKSYRSDFKNFFAPDFNLRCQVENYFREAHQFVPLKMYQCELWFRDTPQSDLVVPFLLSAEMGVMTEFMKEHEPGSPMQEPTPSRSTRAPFVKIIYSMVDFKGSRKQFVSIPSKFYGEIGVYNVPRLNVPASHSASPCTQALSIHLQEFDKRRKAVDPIALEASTIEICTDSDHLVAIRLDDENYGPCYKIKISLTSSFSESNQTIPFPLMNFLPLREDVDHDENLS